MNGILEKLRDPEVLKLLQPAGIGALLGGGGMGLLDYLKNDEEDDQTSRVRSALSSGLLGASLGGLAGAGYGALGAMKQPPVSGPTEDNAYSVIRGASQGNPKLTGAAAGAGTAGLLGLLRKTENGVELPAGRPSPLHGIVEFLGSGESPADGLKKWTEGVQQITGAKGSGGLTQSQLAALKDISIPQNLNAPDTIIAGPDGKNMRFSDLVETMLPEHTATANRSTGNMLGRLMDSVVHPPAKAAVEGLNKIVPTDPTSGGGRLARKFVDLMQEQLPALRSKTVKEYLMSGGNFERSIPGKGLGKSLQRGLESARAKALHGRMSPLTGGLLAGLAGFGGTKLMDSTQTGLNIDRDMVSRSFYDNVVKNPDNIARAYKVVGNGN